MFSPTAFTGASTAEGPIPVHEVNGVRRQATFLVYCNFAVPIARDADRRAGHIRDALPRTFRAAASNVISAVRFGWKMMPKRCFTGRYAMNQPPECESRSTGFQKDPLT